MTLGSLGTAFHSLGQLDKTIEFQTKFLSISRELGDRAGESTALCNLGGAFNSLGLFEKAIEFLTKELSVSLSWETGLGRAGP